jgi:hypothetical protein
MIRNLLAGKGVLFEEGGKGRCKPAFGSAAISQFLFFRDGGVSILDAKLMGQPLLIGLSYGEGLIRAKPEVMSGAAVTGSLYSTRQSGAFQFGNSVWKNTDAKRHGFGETPKPTPRSKTA